METDKKISLQKEWLAISFNLTDKDKEFILKSARTLALKNTRLRELRESGNSPMLYENSSRKLSLTDFIRTEWLEKGWSPVEIERTIVQEFDPKLLKAISDYENKRCEVLPEELRFRKVRNRASRAELQSGVQTILSDNLTTYEP